MMRCDPLGPTTYTLTAQISSQDEMEPNVGAHTYEKTLLCFY